MDCSVCTRKLVHARLTLVHESIDRSKTIAWHQAFDVALGRKLQVFFDFNLYPKALAIEAILVAQFVPGHREVALVGILISTAPGVMNAHRIVSGYGSIQERPSRLARILGKQLLKGADALPELQNRPFLSGEIDLRFNFFKRHEREPQAGCRCSHFMEGLAFC